MAANFGAYFGPHRDVIPKSEPGYTQTLLLEKR